MPTAGMFGGFRGALDMFGSPYRQHVEYLEGGFVVLTWVLLNAGCVQTCSISDVRIVGISGSPKSCGAHGTLADYCWAWEEVHYPLSEAG